MKNSNNEFLLCLQKKFSEAGYKCVISSDNKNKTLILIPANSLNTSIINFNHK